MSDFDNDSFAQQHLDHLQSVGMDPWDDDHEQHLHALEVRDRRLEHGSANPMQARPAQPPTRGARLIGSTRWYSVDELAAQMAVRPRTGNVQVGPWTPEEKDAA